MAMTGDAADRILISAVWRGRPLPADGALLRRAVEQARRNDIDGLFIRAYREELPDDAARVEAADQDFHRNLGEVTARLRRVGVAPILIKVEPGWPYTYSNFDLVVGRDGWRRSRDALADWAARESGHPLERTKRLFHSPTGPAAHLHQSVSWFDIPVIDTESLRSRATSLDGQFLVPDPVDGLRIHLAHAAFQNLALNLAELCALRNAADPAIVSEARALAAGEGWAMAFDVAWQAAGEAMAALDAGETVPLPVPLAPARSVAAGFMHAGWAARRGRLLAALREMALRIPLVAAKRRHLSAT